MAATPDQPDRLPKPAGYAIDPSTGGRDSLYRNIEDNAFIKKIKALEERLLELEDVPSVEEDIEQEAEELGDVKSEASSTGQAPGGSEEREILEELLEDFGQLLKVPYGPIGYLVKSDSESIRHLYGIDTDADYYSMVDGTRIRISSSRLEHMVKAGGGKRLPWGGEEGAMLDDPAETPANESLAEDAVNSIIASIQDKLS